MGKRTWPDGMVYEGEFYRGEKHGEGELIKPTGEKYIGQWQLNSREGEGKWTKTNKEVIDGIFKNNKPNGFCSVQYPNGDLYQGSIVDGVINGTGVYKSMKPPTVYDGEFQDGKRHGTGKFYV